MADYLQHAFELLSNARCERVLGMILIPGHSNHIFIVEQVPCSIHITNPSYVEVR